MAEHNIVHVEFPAVSLTAAANFYTELFGWKHQESGGYWMFDASNGVGGGYNPVGPGGLYEVKPNEVLVYVSTDDIEASLAQVEALGGKKLIGKSPIPGVGWYAVFADPTGNKVGLYTAEQAAA
jgi:predicted enzyme related to lactoylglutathione lyase